MTGTALGPYIVDRTMVRTLRGMAKPKPSLNRKRLAHRRTGWRPFYSDIGRSRRCQMRHRGAGRARRSPSAIRNRLNA